MDDFANWYAENARCLETALARLRDRLQALIETPDQLAPGRDAPPVTGEVPPALTLLARRLGLTPFEQDVLFLAVAPELDTRIGGLCARAQDDPERPFPTFALALALFAEPAWEALAPHRPLRFWRLLEMEPAGRDPLLRSPFRADERIVNFIKGLNHLDGRLAPLLSDLPDAGPAEGLPSAQRAGLDGVVRHLRELTRPRALPIIHLLGPDAADREVLARHAAAALGLHLYRLPVELLPTTAADLEALARLWQRECLLWRVSLYLRAGSEPGPAGLIDRFLDSCSGVVFLDSEAGAASNRTAIALDAARPTAAEQRAAWTELLKPDGGDFPGRLAAQFDLGLTDIRQLVRTAHDGAAGSDLELRLWEACLDRTRPRLGTLAQRLQPSAGWDDLVLPAVEHGLLRQIAGQVRGRATVYDDWGFRRKMSRGTGITVLFAGESGTGKTMAAEVLANDLHLPLYRIDLSAVVNKYIGETEKNLRRLFDAAEGGGAILFFDEADALFGKRSEVKDSHDRFANIEIDYLLQRMEAYRGLAILATNRKAALDPAFLRRLRFVLTFPFPGPEQRKAIWQRVFPAEVPRDGLDYGRLARLNLTGGSIHNIALNAAFLAANAGASVTMPLLFEAARGEFRKLDRPVSDADFG
jgi:hypothetical protein